MAHILFLWEPLLGGLSLSPLRHFLLCGVRGASLAGLAESRPGPCCAGGPGTQQVSRASLTGWIGRVLSYSEGQAGGLWTRGGELWSTLCVGLKLRCRVPRPLYPTSDAAQCSEPSWPGPGSRTPHGGDREVWALLWEDKGPAGEGCRLVSVLTCPWAGAGWRTRERAYQSSVPLACSRPVTQIPTTSRHNL